MRWVRTRVLPLPAPAKMRTGPSVCSTAARWTSLRASVSTIIRRLLFDADGPRASVLARDAQNVTRRLRDCQDAREVRKGRFGAHVGVDAALFEAVATAAAARQNRAGRVETVEPTVREFREAQILQALGEF